MIYTKDIDAGIYGNAGIYDRAFNPLSLNPYLLFDTQSSMIGTFENPTLDLDPSKPDTLNVITATRSGVATYTDAAGLIQSADPNTVRVDHVDGVPMILVEPSATNLVDYSNLDRSGEWYSLGFSVTQNAILSPDGLVSGVKTELTSITRNFTGSFIPSATDTVVTYSFWIKKGSGATHLNQFRIRNSSTGSGLVGSINLETGEIIQNGFGAGNLIVESYPNGWFKVKATRDTGINISDTVWIYPPYESSDGSNEIGQYNYTFGHQLEYGSVATSFIPTSGSTVTRAADNLVISGSDFSDFYNQSEGTVYAETLGRELDFNYVFTISDGTSSNRLVAIHHNFNHIYIQNSGVIQAALDGGTFTAGTLCRYAASFKENDVRVSIDGGAEVTDTTATIPTSTKLNVGSRENGSENLNGHIKRLIYWPYHSDSL